MGMGYEPNAIGAAVVGGGSLRGGVGTMSGTILGALFLTLVVNGIPNIIKIESTLYEGIVVGVVVILAVARNHIRPEKSRPPGYPLPPPPPPAPPDSLAHTPP